jgi:hypothetical protein
MKKMYKIWAFALLLGHLGVAASAQEMAPVIERTESTMKNIERTDRVIEKTVFDFLSKTNNYSYFYTYELYNPEVYHLTLVGDGTRSYSGNVKIFRSVGGEWKLVTQYNSGGVDFNIKFSPTETALYEIVFTCALRPNTTRAGMGLIIDREK